MKKHEVEGLLIGLAIFAVIWVPLLVWSILR